MRIVTLEEHFTAPRIVAGISPDAIARLGFPGSDFVWAQSTKRNELADLGDACFADMDASGITTQVLSVAGPGADLVPGQKGFDLARAYNDALAEACTRHPTRYRGFAHLQLLSPDADDDELQRTVKDLGFHGVLVNGATDGVSSTIRRSNPSWSKPRNSTCRSTSTPASPPNQCATPITTTCLAISASPWRCPPGADTPTPRSIRCGSCCQACSTAIPG